MTGKRLVDKADPSLPKGRDQVLVDDPSATEPLWARFYDIETNRPFFCGRDGVKKWSLNEIEAERRAGYAWIRPFGEAVLKEYAEVGGEARRRGVGERGARGERSCPRVAGELVAVRTASKLARLHGGSAATGKASLPEGLT